VLGKQGARKLVPGRPQETSMARTSQRAQRSNVATVDPIWAELRREAEEVVRAEPALGGFIYATILSKNRLEDVVCHRLAQRLNHSDVDAGLIAETFEQVLAEHPELGRAFRADLAAVFDRDPACSRYIEPLLYFKGFHALVTHRFAHELLKQGRRDFALYLQSQSSRIFAVDINPAARIGIGIMLDHGTGIVIGETAVGYCSILQNVTLGGTQEIGVGIPRSATMF
jgi:serine O-acetyltransferase